MLLGHPATLLSQSDSLVLGTCALALVFVPPLPVLLQIPSSVLVWRSARSCGSLARLLRGGWRGTAVRIAVWSFRRRHRIERLSLQLTERLETMVLAVWAGLFLQDCSVAGAY